VSPKVRNCSSDISSGESFACRAYGDQSQIFCLGQQAHRAQYGSKALDHGRAWHRNLSLFESDDRKTRKGFEQFAGAKQEVGIVRPTEPFVAAREGLVD
jgi:hypothetical protein